MRMLATVLGDWCTGNAGIIPAAVIVHDLSSEDNTHCCSGLHDYPCWPSRGLIACTINLYSCLPEHVACGRLHICWSPAAGPDWSLAHAMELTLSGLRSDRIIAHVFQPHQADLQFSTTPCSRFYFKPSQEQRLRSWQRSNMTSGLAGAHFGPG